MLAFVTPVLLQILGPLEFSITALSETCIYISSNAGVEVRVSVVVDELFGAQITPEFRLREQILDQRVDSVRGHVFFLAVWAVVALLSVSHHAVVAQ